MDERNQMSNSNSGTDGGPNRPSNLVIGLAFVVFLVVGGALFAALMYMKPDYSKLLTVDSTDSPVANVSTPGSDVDTLPSYRTVGSAGFVERSGDSLNLTDLRGDVLVVDFFFTTCKGQCPMMTARMMALQDTLTGVDGVRLVSITVDPETDTPQQLRKFAANYHADSVRWLFLRSSKQEVRDLAHNTFMLSVSDSKDPKEPVTHSNRFMLVDKSGTVRGYYDSFDPRMQARLVKDIEALLHEGKIAEAVR